jgi:SAM-dependent methyltransferase
MGHLNSRLLWHKYAEKYFKDGLRILEIGPAGHPSYYEKCLNERGVSLDYNVLDVRFDFISGAEKNPRFIFAENPFRYPLEDNSFDIVFSDQVLAHVEYFWKWYEELYRITKPGGCIITINSYSYPSCPSPIDAWRIHSDGMKLLNKSLKLTTLISSTESAELDHYKIPDKPGYYFPGASMSDPFNTNSKKNLQINLMKRTWNNLIGRIPVLRALLLNPVQVAFDTITIAQKSDSDQ